MPSIGMQANMRQIMAHETKDNPRAQASTAVTRGFEACAYPKIVRQLQDPQLVVRQKALLAARELLASPTGHIQCIAAGISGALIELLQDGDAVVRERAAGTLEFVMGKEVGARDVIKRCGVSRLIMCLKDTESAVRSAAYQALIEAARFEPMRRELCDQGALSALLQQALKEPQYTLKGLRVLNACVQVRHNHDALHKLNDEANAIPSVSGLLTEQQTASTQEQAAQLLGLLTSGSMEAKVQAVQVGSVPKLLQLLQSSHNKVACAAATALMNITVSRDGKYAAIKDTQALALLVRLLNPHSPEMCNKVTEIVANLCEAPEARPLLLECGVGAALLDVHNCETATDMLRHSAAQALRQTGFKHLPFSVLPGRTVDIGADGYIMSVPARAVPADA